MKKLIYIITIIILLISNFTFSQNSKEIVKNLEMSQYYGYVSLIVDLHIEIGKGETEDKSLFLLVGLIHDMKYYSDLNIVNYLSYSFDLNKSFDYLLFDIGDILNQTDIVLVELKKSLDSLKQKRFECDSLKDVVDQNFSLALKDLNVSNMEINMNKSLEYQSCSSDARIKYNVNEKILKELIFYFEILTHKYNYFYNNKFNIIENYDEILFRQIN